MIGSDSSQTGQSRRDVLKQLGMVAGVGAIGGSTVAGELTRPVAAQESDPDAFSTSEHEIESFDGTTIAATLYEPTASGPHPAILMTHGWGGSRGDLTDLAASYASREYVVLAYDSRGFGESGGQVTSTGPNERKDASELITWLAGREAVQTDGEENPRLGMDGYSYGGGIQFRTAAYDDRVDAIVPRVTWNDTAQALAPNGVLKFGWFNALSIGAEDANVDPALNERSNAILGRRAMTEDDRAYYRSHSPVGYPDDVDAPTLIVQDWNDRLFPVNQALANYEWLQSMDTEAALIVGNGGTHFFGSPRNGEAETQAYTAKMAMRWLDGHLKGDGAPEVPTVSYWDQGEQEFRTADSLPPDDADVQTFSRSLDEAVTLEPGAGATAWDFPIRERTELVGVPTLRATVSPVGDGPNHLLVALQRVSGGDVRTIKEQVTPVAVDAETEIELDLFGVQDVLEAGDRLRLAVAARDEPLSEIPMNFVSDTALYVDTAEESAVELRADTDVSLSVPTREREPAVPTPAVESLSGGEATGQPQTASVHDLSSYGYTESEYAFSGEARTTAEPPLFFDGEIPEEDAPYASRMLVYRPEDPADFNGRVVVEWANVTQQRDAPVVWVNAYDYLMREGYAVVVVSAQSDGVDTSDDDRGLADWDPERYGDLTHPGDAYAFDIFSQAIKSLIADTDPNPLGGLLPEYIYATGMSQSGYYLQPYIESVQPDHGLVDGFLPVAAQLVGDITSGPDSVLLLNTEDEAPGLIPETDTPIPNNGNFTLWEVAGASHVNFWLTVWFDVMDARDFGEEPDWFEAAEPEWDPAFAGQYGQLEDAVYGRCGTNYFPVRHAYRAALARLDEWVRNDQLPPQPERIAYDDEQEVLSDDDGNVQGGLRLPPMAVPVATYLARDQVCSGPSPLDSLAGATERFETGELRDRYDDRETYLEEFRTAIDEAVESGSLLEEDGATLLTRAERIEGLGAPGTGAGDATNGSDATDGADGPGLGITAAVTGLGGAGYLLARRRGGGDGAAVEEE